jgi:hypothetical protein
MYLIIHVSVQTNKQTKNVQILTIHMTFLLETTKV